MRFRCTAVFIAALLLGSPAIADDRTRFISVSGQGSAEVPPDMATVTLGVQNQAKSAEAAMRENSAAVTRVISGLQGAGLQDRDIQTTGLSLNPVYERRNSSSGQPPRLVGFSASNMLTVRVRDLNQLGGVLDRVIDAGATNFRGLSFGLSDRSAALEDARRAAVADALARASVYAEAAGVSLGEVISISEAGVSPIRGPRVAMEAMSLDSVPISPGELTISASVTLTIALN